MLTVYFDEVETWRGTKNLNWHVKWWPGKS